MGKSRAKIVEKKGWDIHFADLRSAEKMEGETMRLQATGRPCLIFLSGQRQKEAQS